jgi:hypothetical protein
VSNSTQLAGLAPLASQRDPWAKLGGQLATGSGKTKMMSLLVAWWYLNAVRERGGNLGAGRHAILIAPGLFVRDRLFQDFFPPAGGASVFFIRSGRSAGDRAGLEPQGVLTDHVSRCGSIPTRARWW